MDFSMKQAVRAYTVSGDRMFRAIHMKHKKTVLISLVCLVIAAAAGFLALRSAVPDTIMIRGERYSTKVRNQADIEAFLAACGYDSPELLFEHEITIPKHWNETYTSYDELQRSQGFDLLPYKGKAAQEHVYFVSEGRNITVLTSGGRIVAAHICDCDGSEMKLIIG